ncbi:glycoside hydrolase/deacetylase [Rhizoclosmatium globosum]|uniref:Glycoside hydrolase/deacetylase n=1 Tax=Rhizoclosmatium globosum TaxID=329046 RepID=A0A1Y2C5E6_9FUNG|nr:glycoside hydrolase/deacetylase [Rhizoclosmatium globosum]|eukprot:ORY42258.1 glycoside hydrolase/deacetylase [Rhizoclosmatium globosum]
MSNNFDWAPKPWTKAPATPVWTQYFKQANPTPVFQKDDLRACTAPGKIWGATFDDGPSPATHGLLDYFRTINMHTTFYTVGSVAIKYPEVLLQTYQAGHEIGVHTWSHPLLTKLSDDEIVAELIYSAKTIYQLTGQAPKYIRPPFGGSDDRVRRIANSMGLTVVGFVDTEDWKHWDSKAKMQPVVTGHFKEWIKNGVTGLITLQHDVWAAEVEVGKEAMDLLVKAGYTVKPVYECLGAVLEGFFKSGQFEEKWNVVAPYVEKVVTVTPNNGTSGNLNMKPVPAKVVVSAPVETTVRSGALLISLPSLFAVVVGYLIL